MSLVVSLHLLGSLHCQDTQLLTGIPESLFLRESLGISRDPYGSLHEGSLRIPKGINRVFRTA